MNRNIYLQESNLSSLNATIHRFPLKSHRHYFTVEVGIGNPVVQKTLVFDPSSGVTWTQCKPCLKCFKQHRPLFDTKKSSSYKNVSTFGSFSKMFICGIPKCSFRQKYCGGRYFASGMAAVVRFTFQTATGGVPYRTNHLAFGCGTKTNINYLPPAINGVMGFNQAPIYFARQLQIKSRFSYCVPAIFETNTTSGYSYLKFGDEAVMRNKDIQSNIETIIMDYKAKNYRVLVNGLSMKGEILHSYKLNYYVIDLNTPFTSLRYEVFWEMEEKLGEHFAKFGVSRVSAKLPLGNKRFIFDLRNKQVSFAMETC